MIKTSSQNITNNLSPIISLSNSLNNFLISLKNNLDDISTSVLDPFSKIVYILFNLS
jgi:hypothetical protein